MRRIIVALFVLLALGLVFAPITRPKKVQAQSIGSCGRYSFGAIGQCATLVASASPSPVPLCIGGTLYNQVAQDDEFPNDSTLNATNNAITNTPAPGLGNSGWSTQTYYSGRYTDGSSGNVTWYTYYSPTGDSNFSNFQGYQGLNGHPLALALATTPPITGTEAGYTANGSQPWVAGALQGPQYTYGYAEWSAEVPSAQGIWPSLWTTQSSGYTPSNTYPYFREGDIQETFGTLNGANSNQQTDIFVYGASPPTAPPQAFYSSETIPTMSTAYHTYGMLWTAGSPGNVTMYVDRVPQTNPNPVQTVGPFVPIAMLRATGGAGYGGAPTSNGPYYLRIAYYRLLQTTGTTCNGSSGYAIVPTAPPVTYSAPPAASSLVSVVNPSESPVATTGYGLVNAHVSSLPSVGHMLLSIWSSLNGVGSLGCCQSQAIPNGWQQVDTQGNVWACIVGTGSTGGINNGTPCPAATTYPFNGNGSASVTYEISGMATSPPIVSEGNDQGPLASSTAYTVSTISTVNEPIPAPSTLTLTTYSANQNTCLTAPSSLAEYLPPGQTSTALLTDFGQTITASSTTASLVVNKLTTDAYSGGPVRYPTYGTWVFPSNCTMRSSNSAVISILPAGATPVPIPAASVPVQYSP